MTDSPAAALTARLADDIRAGRLPPGTRLPTHRQLAARERVARATATKAYAGLKAMGLVVGETGRGTFVRDRPDQRGWDGDDEARLSASAVDLSFNHPTLPGQAEMLREMLRNLAAEGDLAALLHQQPPGGRRNERETVCRFLARARGVTADPAHVFLVNGAQHGLDVAVRTLLRPGERIAADALSYPGLKMLARAQGIALDAVPGTPAGPDLEALDALCARRRIRAIYAMPTLHNPLGWVLDRPTRTRLVAIARRHDCMLIEDAAYAWLVPDAPPPLAALAPERCIHVASLSKGLASGLRVGFMVVPPALASAVKAQIRANLWSLPGLTTAMATRWIADGTVERQEAAHRRDARQRQRIARRAFSGLAMTAHPGSLFLWLTLPESLRMDRIGSALAARDIAVSKAEAYAIAGHAPHALRLGLSSMPLTRLPGVLHDVRAVIDGFPI